MTPNGNRSVNMLKGRVALWRGWDRVRKGPACMGLPCPRQAEPSSDASDTVMQSREQGSRDDWSQGQFCALACSKLSQASEARGKQRLFSPAHTAQAGETTSILGDFQTLVG